jgi:hypothetical protein
VSPWQSNGNLLEYVKRNVDVDHIGLVCQLFTYFIFTISDAFVGVQLRGSAAGLSYLHSRRVVHGNGMCLFALICFK